MKKLERIKAIRSELLNKNMRINSTDQIREYFELLPEEKGKFLDYILNAGLTIKGILKPIDRRSYVSVCNELIERIFEDNTQYEVIYKHCQTESSRRLCIANARTRNKKILKIYHERGQYIETIKLN